LAAPRAQAAPVIADFIFAIDTSFSMRSDIDDIANQLGAFPGILNDFGIDGWYAVIAFATNLNGPEEPRLITDGFINDGAALVSAVSGLSDNIITNAVESGTEAITFALTNPLLIFRPEAVRNMILITDGNDDRPVVILNSEGGGREPPTRWPPDPTGPDADFQERIDSTSDLLIAGSVILNMVINPLQAPARFQYGDPDATRLDPDGLLDVAATLAALGENNQNLQGQLLTAGIVSRAFRIADARQSPAVFWPDFFRTKATEVIPEPGSFALLLGALVGIALLRRGS
jgi:hypothetical protein